MRGRSIVLVAALVVAGCSSDATSVAGGSTTVAADSTQATVTATSEAATTTAVATTAPTTTTASTTTVDPVSADARRIVEALADESLAGRGNATPGSEAARRLLIDEVAQFAQPIYADRAGDAGFVQEFPGGANVLAVIPGGELADQYVVVGAHYDHLGSDCDTTDPADTICNGATDNATGVAAAMTIARQVAAVGTPRRSVLIAFWDREEDGLLGAKAYVAAPAVPLESVSAYVNFDIQGADLLPSLADATVVVGAETGGADFVQMVRDAADAETARSGLRPVLLSLLFGQGRSDHAVFAAAGVPSVFFTDANTPCYHTAQDDLRAVDFPKLDRQISMVHGLVAELIATDTPPVFDPTAPATTFEDARSMLAVTSSAVPDFGRLDPEAAADAADYVARLQEIVDAGPDAFDDAAVASLLDGAVTFVDALTHGTCEAAGGS